VPQDRLGGEVAELDVFGGEMWCGHGASFSSEITPSLQGSTIYLGLRFSYVWAELSKKIGVSQFGFGGGLTELVFAEKRGVVGEVTLSSTITPRPQASPFYLGFQFLYDREEPSQKTGVQNYLSLAENRGVVKDATFPSSITPSFQSSLINLWFR
jgi:hypothetical protein